MNIKTILSCLTISFFISCTENTNHTETSENNQKDTVVSKQIDSTLTTQHKTTSLNWFDYHQISKDDFEIDSASTMFKPEEVQYGLYDEQKELYSTTFMYSPDSSFYIDIDSYSLELSKDSSGHYEYGGREMDIKVQLVKIATSDSVALQLMMCGTSCLPQDAIWENDTTVSILGLSEDSHGKEIPTIWQYNLISQSFLLFKAKESSANKGVYFEEGRLQTILNKANSQNY